MAVKFECPECGHETTAEHEPYVADGDIYECSNCGGEIIISMDYEPAEKIEEDINNV